MILELAIRMYGECVEGTAVWVGRQAMGSGTDKSGPHSCISLRMSDKSAEISEVVCAVQQKFCPPSNTITISLAVELLGTNSL